MSTMQMALTLAMLEWHTFFRTKRWAVYLLLTVILPVSLGFATARLLADNPKILATIGGLLPVVLSLTPTLAIMLIPCIALFPLVLLSVLGGSGFVAGEEGQGTLALLASKPVARWQLLLVRFAAFSLVLLVLAVSAILLGLAEVGQLGIGPVPPREAVAYLLYMAGSALVYSAVGAFFSVIARDAARATLLSLIAVGAWLALDMMIPYLPRTVVEIVQWGSLTFYLSSLVHHISGGNALLCVAGGGSFLGVSPTNAWLAVTMVTALIAGPLALGAWLLEQRDIQP